MKCSRRAPGPAVVAEATRLFRSGKQRHDSDLVAPCPTFAYSHRYRAPDGDVWVYQRRAGCQRAVWQSVVVTRSIPETVRGVAPAPRDVVVMAGAS